MTKSEKILDTLCKSGYNSFIVGGYVRDLFLGHNSNDIDIVTAAKPNEVENLFKDRKIKTVGKSFNVVLVDGIEVATFRSDKYSGLSNKNVEISYTDTICNDLSRRDLTINSIAYCPFTGEIIDPFNGLNDIKNKIIKFTGTPEKRILKDPTRIIRACRFKALINGEFNNKTKDALIKYAHLLMEFVDKERIKLEIMKAMNIQNTSLFFKALREIGALQYIFESLDNTFDYNNKEDHGKYHNESIIDHCMMCGDNITTRKPLLKLAGYLHDIGKPLTYHIENQTNNISFHKHEEIGECYSELELIKLRFSIKDTKYVKSLIKMHMRNFKTPRAIRRTLSTLNDNGISWKDLYQLKMADCKSNMKKQGYAPQRIKRDCINIRTEIKRPDHVNKFSNLAITGKDIMEILNLKPGKEIGIIKNKLFEIILDEPELNNKIDLIKLIKENNKWN